MSACRLVAALAPGGVASPAKRGCEGSGKGEQALRGRRAAADQMEAFQHSGGPQVFSLRPPKRQKGLSLRKAAPTPQTVPCKKQTVAQPEGCATAAPQVELATAWDEAPLGFLDLGGETMSVAPCPPLRPSLCAAAVSVVRRLLAL